MNNSYSLGEQVVWSTPASTAVQSPTRAVRLEIIGKIKVFPDKIWKFLISGLYSPIKFNSRVQGSVGWGKLNLGFSVY